MSFVLLLHLYAVLIWVGGMFFAYVVLRPAAVDVLEPPPRLRLWNAVFRRFFTWVWSAIVVLLASGFYMISGLGGMGQVLPHVHVMLLLGVVMIAIFSYVFFACYVPLSLHVSREQWQEAGAKLARIRTLVAVNLTLGLVTIGVTVIGMRSGW